MLRSRHIRIALLLFAAKLAAAQTPDALALNALGEKYASTGDYQDARDPFARAVALKPDFGLAQLNLGETLLHLGNHVSAAEHLDSAIRLLGRGDDLASAHYLRARLFTAEENIPKAMQQLQQAVAIRPAFPQAWSDLGEARKALSDDAGALKAFQHAIELSPDDSVAQYRLGAEYLDLDQWHKAVEHLEIAYRLTPDDQSTLNALQKALRKDGHLEEANVVKERLARLLREQDQANQNALAGVALNNEGANLEKAGNRAAAVEKYEAAVQLAPKDVAIRVNYAVALLRLGQWTKGLTELHEALTMDPANAKIQQTLREAVAQAPAGTVPDWKGR